MRQKQKSILEWNLDGVVYSVIERAGKKWMMMSSQTAAAPMMEGKPFVERDPLKKIKWLNEFVRAHGLYGKRVFLSLPRSDAFLRWMQAPLTSPEEAQAAAEREFPYPLERMAWGYGENLLVGVPYSAVDMHVEAVEAAGLSVAEAGFRFLSQMNAFGRLAPPEFSEGPCAILDVTTATAELTVGEKDHPIFCRYFRATGSVLAEQVEETIVYLKKLGRLKKQPAIFISGDAATSAQVGSYLKKNFRVEPAPAALAALGAAMPDRKGWFTWVHPPVLPAPSFAESITSRQARVLLMVSACLVLGALPLRQWAADKSAALDNRRMQTRRHETPRFSSETVLEAARRLPAGTRVIECAYDGDDGKLRLRGRAPSYEKVSEVAANLSRGGSFRDVKTERANLVQTDGAPAVEFSVEGRP